MPRLLELRTDADGVVSLVGELDRSVESWFSATAQAILTGPRDCVLDLSELAFIDASGVRAIVALATCEGRPRRVVLRNAPTLVRRVLDILDVDARMGVFIEQPPAQPEA